MDNDLGRLIRTLKDRCSECHHPMQLRARKIDSLVRGVESQVEEEYKVCSNCGFELEIPLRDRKKRVEYPDKTAYVKEPVDNNRRDSAKYPKRNSTSKNDGNISGKGSGRNFKRGS